MKTKLELQAQLIKHLKSVISDIIDKNYTDVTIKCLESEIAELEKQGTELPPVEQPGKSAEEILKKHVNPILQLLNIDDYFDVYSYNKTILKAMKEYRTAGMPSEDEIDERFAVVKNKDDNYVTEALNNAAKFKRIGAKWVITKWKGEK